MHDHSGNPDRGSQRADGSVAGSTLRWAAATAMFGGSLAKVLAVLWTPRHRHAPNDRVAARSGAGGPTTTPAGL